MPVQKSRKSHCLLHSAVWHQHPTIVRLLLDAGSVPNAGNNEGDSPLIVAVRTGDTRLVELLIQYGAHVNQLSPSGNNVIHEAVDHIYEAHDFQNMFEVLMKHGADVNLHSCLVSDLTPLSRALFYERLDIAAILIRHGADVNSYDTLLHEYNLCVARRKNYFHIAKLIVMAGFAVRHSTHDLPHRPHNQLYDTGTMNGWLAHAKYNPLNLAQLCRVRIRQQCGTNVYAIAEQLPLPLTLKSYLKLEDVGD